MISYDTLAFNEMMGNISQATITFAKNCVSQCTGCMCNCRCSCSGGIISDFEWEEL